MTLTEGTTTLSSLNLASATASSSGSYALTIPGGDLALGANNLRLAYSGDANYSAASSSLTITGVNSLSTYIVLSYATPLAGQAFTMNALIDPAAQAGVPHTGTLTFSDNGSVLASVNLSSTTPSTSGFYALNVPVGLPLGSNVLTVAYSGDSNYGPATDTTTLSVNNDSFSLGYASSVLAGNNYTASVAINGALVNNTPRTGTLSLVEGSTTLVSVNLATTTPSSSGYYALTVPGGLPAGTYSNLKITYSGDSIYSALSATMSTLTVSNDVLAFSYASSQALLNQPFSMNVAVQTNPGIGAVPTGTLTLTAGTTTLSSLNLASATASSSGYYTLSVPAGDLALGSNSLKLAYSGDSNFAAASSSFAITGVTSLTTSLGLGYATPLAGQAFTMFAAVNPTLAGLPHTGTLTLSDNGSALASVNLSTATPSSSGYYALSVPAGLPAGANVLTVSYSGDSNYAATTGTATLTVNNDSLSLSYSTLATVGQAYTVNVGIAPVAGVTAVPSGTLTLMEGTTVLATLSVSPATLNSSGKYVLTVPAGLVAGANSLKVVYSGDSNFSPLTVSLATITAS